MDGERERFAVAHGGVFTRSVALAAGDNDAVIQTHCRTGVWKRLRRGCYILGDSWNAMDERQRHVAGAHALALRCDSDLVFSHATAAAIHGLPLWRIPTDPMCVTRGSAASGRLEAGVHHHIADLTRDQIVRVNGLAVTSLERTMNDVARTYGTEPAIAVCDAALRAGADPSVARQIFDREQHWPGARGVGFVLGFADQRAESVGESRLRYRLHRLGITGFVPQVLIYGRSGRFLGRSDLADLDRGVVLEFDGKTKYGIEGQDAREQLWDEKLREDAFRQDALLEVGRFTWFVLDDTRTIYERVMAACDRARELRARRQA